jgi:hypothetical protein
MPFTWDDSTTMGSFLKKNFLREVKENTDWLADQLGISHFSWSELSNINSIIFIRDEIYDEIQDAVDYILDNMLCTSENYSFFDTVDSGQKSSVNSDDDSGYNSSKFDTDDVALNGSINMDNDSTICPSNNVSVLSGRCSGHYSYNDAGYNAGVLGAECTADHVSVCSSTRGSNCPTNRASYDGDLNTGYYYGNNTGVYSSKNNTVT